LNVAVIAIAQLNREAEKNQDGKPRMSNLRECGAFEQDADHVWLLWRAEYYAKTDELKAKLEGEAELLVAKNRDGSTREVRLTFLKELTRFESRCGDQLYSPHPENWEEGYRQDERGNGATAE
jgi:replicative DNA helicase